MMGLKQEMQAALFCEFSLEVQVPQDRLLRSIDRSGDLNDVAWSTTTRRFQRLSCLLNPRVGRGFYPTFNAFYPFLRWPLDHLFHDPKFRLNNMQRLPAIGSDHFSMLFSLALTAGPGDSVLPELPRDGEEGEVTEMIDEAKEMDREPIGTDWETN